MRADNATAQLETVNAMALKSLSDLAISSQAAIIAEGSTTIPSGSTAKWSEVRGSMKKRPLRDRFFEKVDTEKSEIFWNGIRCHEWTGCLMKGGYGQVHHQGATAYSHRIAWELLNGPIMDGLYVLHRCDNRKCVNPEHLFLGTFDDNMADMFAKMRYSHGAKRYNAKLTDEAVREIRSSSEKQAVLAERYGVTQSSISMAKSGSKWRHVEKI